MQASGDPRGFRTSGVHLDQLKHQRIDKGIKRGNPHERSAVTGQYLPVIDTALAELKLDDNKLIERIAAGEAPVRIAEELGVARQALYMRYAGNEAYQVARAVGAEVRLDSAECEITEAQDPFTLARARERFRAVAWRCEREYPARWGLKQELELKSGEFTETLKRISEEKLRQRTEALKLEDKSMQSVEPTEPAAE